MTMMRAGVLLLCAAAGRGSDDEMAARIALLNEQNAKIAQKLEKVRGAISYWGERGWRHLVLG